MDRKQERKTMGVPKEFFDGLDSNFDKQKEDDAKRRLAEENTERWEPEAGDVLKGTFVEVKYLPTKYGIKPMAVVDEEGTDLMYEVWCSPTVLRSAMEDATPPPGTLIGIKFDGFIETPEGDYDGYNMYLVHIPELEEAAKAVGEAHWLEAEKVGDIRAEKKRKADAAKREDRPQRPDEAPF